MFALLVYINEWTTYFIYNFWKNIYICNITQCLHNVHAPFCYPPATLFHIFCQQLKSSLLLVASTHFSNVLTHRNELELTNCWDFAMKTELQLQEVNCTRQYETT